MRRRSSALVGLASLLLAGPAIAAADTPIGGITIGASVIALAKTLGMPQSVESTDTGNRFVFADGTAAYADDDGVVLAVDMRAGSAQVDVDGKLRTFAVGTYSAARADAELAAAAEFSTPMSRSYRLGPRRDLVLGFASASSRLERVTYGEPGQLVRLGLLPGDAAAKAVAYRAPQPRRPVALPATGTEATVYRIAIDRGGAVTDVNAIIGSPFPARDAEITRPLRHERYAPATLDGRPIAATVFVELHH